jgi:negative regulator of genetic competence, sporulation and motility
MGFVYLLVQVSPEGPETYKVGVSKNSIEKRISQLQTGNPNKIMLLNFYESENYKKVERIMHRRYHKEKTLAKNEWFTLTNTQVFSFLIDCIEADKTVKFLKENNAFYS